MTELITSTRITRESPTTSSCVSWSRSRPSATTEDQGDDDNDGEGRSPDRPSWRQGWWKRQSRRARHPPFIPRQNGDSCLEWDATTTTRTTREVVTSIRWEQVIRSETWTVTPNCPAETTIQSQRDPARETSAGFLSLSPLRKKHSPSGRPLCKNRLLAHTLL